MQSGQFDEATSLLERCRERRPDDPDIWRARLNLAAPPKTLPTCVDRSFIYKPTCSPTRERLALRAWLASHVGNADAERQALEQLMPIVHDSWAMDRLALLAWNAGQTDRAREYRRLKAELDAAKDRYRLLVDEPLTPDRFVELATLAEFLGRRFEARGWWSLRARSVPADRRVVEALTRLAQLPEPAPIANEVTLADLLADIDPVLKVGSERPRQARPEQTRACSAIRR